MTRRFEKPADAGQWHEIVIRCGISIVLFLGGLAAIGCRAAAPPADPTKPKEQTSAAPKLKKGDADCKLPSTVCDAQCNDPGVVCLNAQTGDYLCSGHRLPEKMIEGQRLLIRLVGIAGQDSPKNIEVAINATATPDTLIRPEPKKPPGSPGIQGEPLPPPPAPIECDVATIFSKDYQVPVEPGVRTVTLTVLNSATGESRAYTAQVDHGRYWIEVGLAMPFVIDGVRRVNASRLPASSVSQTISVSRDVRATPAVMLNVFPGGRNASTTSSFERCTGCRCAANVLGLQAGVGLDFSQVPSFYFGGVVELVSGLSLNGGVTLVQGQFVPPNYQERMLLPIGDTLTPDTRYMVRPYLGFTATTDIVTTLTSAFGSAGKIKL